VVLNSELKIVTANQSFYETFKVRPEETIGNFIYDLGNRQWDIPKLRVLFEEILPHDTVFSGYEVEHDFLDIGRKTMLLNARQIYREKIGSHIILLAMEDITERKQLETEIQDARKYAENIVETVVEPLVVLNSDLKILTANHSFYHTFKVRPAETIGSFIYDLGNRQWDIPTLRVLFEEILPHDTVINGYEVEHDFLGIGRKTILLNARQIFREDIGSNIILLAMEDITERKQLAAEIQDAREYAENIVETVREPLVVLNSELKILTANHSFYNTFKVTPEETIGKFIYDLGNRQWDIPGLRLLFEEILPQETVLNGYEVEHVFLDIGRKVILLNARQIFRKNIGSNIILLAMEDITERKLAAAALEMSEKKFFNVFHSVPALIGISTLKEGRFIDVNEAYGEALGYRREEMIGKTSNELDLWEDESQRVELTKTLQEQGSVRNVEVRLKVKTGQFLIGLFSAELIDIDGAWRMLSIVRDITERKLAEEEIDRLNADLAARADELEAVNKELETFNYTVAHDLRQPLNVMSMYCQSIKLLCGDQIEGECLGYVEDAYKATLRMDNLIGALLNFSRMGRVEPHRASVDLSLLAQEVAQSLQMTEPGRQVDFRIPEGIVANGDGNLLRAVLDNLLGNAWKYSGMQGRAVIEFGVTDIDGVPAYFVRDNGAGFAMTDADKLFTPFQRLPGAEVSKGFGIGLATVERIIRKHGGRVWAEGEPGQGATFYFTLS
jgi:PAS domain S-box-containing protein